MSFWGFVGTAIVLAIVLRGLRSIFQWVDYIACGLIIILPIAVGIANGFWAGVGTFVVASIAVGLLFGVGGGTDVRHNGHNYTMTCRECGYEGLEILGREGNVVYTKCKRCGNHCANTLIE